MELIARIWREVAKNGDMSETVQRIYEFLPSQLRFVSLTVRHIDFRLHYLTTVGKGSVANRAATEPARNQLYPKQLDSLAAWCRRGAYGRYTKGDEIFELAMPSAVEGEALIAPLVNNSEPIGLLIFISEPNFTLTTDHEKTCEALLEPLCALIVNHEERLQKDISFKANDTQPEAMLRQFHQKDIGDIIIGSKTGLKTVIEQVDQVAPTKSPVLILGETGTGKEVIARAIHARSLRSSGPLFRVNCGAISPELIDSDLFGHERGSFTGAVGARKGWFERAHGGTLFLDEVSELSLGAQVRLLRVLQDGLLERVGGQSTISVDVRVVAATNANMTELVSTGSFREDLWYRISVFPIRLPPLRERVGDIEELARFFANRAGERICGIGLIPTIDDLNQLASYSWPGNVRELAAVIERAAILGRGKYLEVSAALGIITFTDRGTYTLPANITEQSAEIERDLTLDEMIIRHIMTVLKRTRGRIEGPHGAAAILGINPCTLRSRMRKLGIDWARFRIGPEDSHI